MMATTGKHYHQVEAEELVFCAPLLLLVLVLMACRLLHIQLSPCRNGTAAYVIADRKLD